MDISFSDEFFYTSASSCRHEMCLYRAPTNPNRLKLSALSGFQTEPTTPSTYEDASSNLDEFQFETIQRFFLSSFNIETNQTDVNPFYHMQEQNQRLQKQHGNPLPTVAFAEELFCDGKFLPLTKPLKLPPRLLGNGNDNKMSTQSSTATSPKSLRFVFRLSFSSHSLWNDDFDPFMAALEKVKEEKIGKPKEKHGLETNSDERTEAHCCVPAQLICELHPEPWKKTSGSSNMLSEPKGLVFPKQVRVGNGVPFEPKGTLSTQFAMERKEHEFQRCGFCTRKRKREQIMKFFLGNAHLSKASAKHKLEALVKPAFVKKLNKKHGSLMQSFHWEKMKQLVT